jgi:hypothetical protein
MKLIELLGKALGLLRLLAAGTTTTLDDQAVELLQAIYDSPALLKWFEDLLKTAPLDPTTGTLSMTADPPEEIVQELRDRKIDWSKLVEYLPVLIQIVRAFAG